MGHELVARVELVQGGGELVLDLAVRVDQGGCSVEVVRVVDGIEHV